MRYMRVILLCVLMSLALAPAAAQRAVSQTTDVAKYIGLRHGPTLPHELKLIGGGLVSAVGDEKEYAMSEVHRGRTRKFEPIPVEDFKCENVGFGL